MRSKLFWSLPGLLLIGLGGVAMPVQAVEQQRLPAFLAVDKDQDGSISPTEAAAVPGLLEQLTRLDANGDGKVSNQEYAALRSETPGASGMTSKTHME